ncbi:ribbon-helix-helix protein, CopG family [Vulcanisaeta souniana]|uniref:CopG family transcriptional regulator n=1 Tax=Vulcanisaeta souniana JCM 11219 TaxID=1293586 RepID=A0A830ECX8_9CREN|nr:ribbon-helix-helix protein, CopG family [Vulcanisaeta souniana]BDR91386.1 CopG family transcriptional regulator [Vulcanisaeta souniana JCM 11219]GGI72789.1 CopG family transcriptional regulator [Vulcanisaeta souniana JCM 11219]
MSEVFIIDDVPVKYEDLFRAPEKEGAVVSVRVHKSVKELLTKLAEKEGLDGVSELLRYLVAGYIMGKYKLVRPEPKVITQPIFLNVNISKKAIEEHTDMAQMGLKMEIDELIKESMDVIGKVKKGVINPKGNEYIRRLRNKAVKYMIKALKYGLEEDYEKLKTIQMTLTTLLEEQ